MKGKIIICPACKNPLREKGAGGLTLDTCYGGCGDIWFDAKELERVSANAANSLHSIWRAGQQSETHRTPQVPALPGHRVGPEMVLRLQKVEIDQCPKCGGVWLDAGEFSQIYSEINGARITPPGWASAMAEAAVHEQSTLNPSGARKSV